MKLLRNVRESPADIIYEFGDSLNQFEIFLTFIRFSLRYFMCNLSPNALASVCGCACVRLRSQEQKCVLGKYVLFQTAIYLCAKYQPDLLSHSFVIE